MSRIARLARTVAALSCVAALVGGCGSSNGDADDVPRSGATTGTSATTPGALPPACDLVTEADAATAFGEPVVAGPAGQDECWWSTANDLKTVNVIRRTDEVETWRSGYQNSFWVPNDLGDEGYTGKAFTSIVFRIGAVQYEINVVYSTRGDPEQVVEDLADIVVSRL